MQSRGPKKERIKKRPNGSSKEDHLLMLLRKQKYIVFELPKELHNYANQRLLYRRYPRNLDLLLYLVFAFSEFESLRPSIEATTFIR